MKTVTRQKVVDYEVYIAKDGKEFTSKTDCENHEKVLNGERKECTNCGGTGYVNRRYIEPYEHWEGQMGGYWESDKCPKCNGKGYLEKKTVWE